jgi:hypothetical protein
MVSSQVIKNQLKNHSLYPFIADSMSNEFIFAKDYPRIIEEWANSMTFPWTGPRDVTSLAQYYLMREGEKDYLVPVHYGYLDFMKQKLLEIAPGRQVEPFLVTKAKEKMAEGKTFTELVDFLGLLNFEEPLKNPFGILASLPLRVYVTTSYYQFLEVMLTKANKTPRSVIYPWNIALVDTINGAGAEVGRFNIFLEDKLFEATEDHPLVIHLFGRDDEPDSLVLTENDYLDFVIKLTSDNSGNVGEGANPATKDILRVLRDTLASNTMPLLLGYDLLNWDFRVLFRGLMGPKKDRALPGLYIQLSEQDGNRKKIEEFLPNYAKTAYNLNIIWRSPQDCLEKLKAIQTGAMIPNL